MVARHDGDLLLVQQPLFRGRRLAVGQERDRAVAIKIADERSVALVAPPSPIADSNSSWRRETRRIVPSHGPQRRVLGDRHHQASSQSGRGASTEGETEMIDEIVEPCRSPGPWFQNIRIEALGENPSTTGWDIAMEAPRLKVQPDVTAREWQVEKEARVSAMHPRRVFATDWARTERGGGAHRDLNCKAAVRRLDDHEAGWHASRTAKRLSHDADPADEARTDNNPAPSKLRQSLSQAD